jgi:phenazine biosynthesis protein phzE
MTALLDEVLSAPAFALLCRPGGRLEVFVGDPLAVRGIADLPVGKPGAPEVIAVLPYRQIADRGLPCVDDGAPLLAFTVRAGDTLDVGAALRRLPADETRLEPGGFDVSDEEYEAIVRRVIAGDIGRGTGSNFVIRRSFRAVISDYSRRAALAVFRRLLAAEHGTYWTFIVHCGGRTLIGATPECHARLDGGVAAMNPISGTYRYPEGGPTARGLRRFLADRKETEELFMVVDEELKMMAKVCDGGGRLRGPWLRPMSRLAHTEYVIDGPSRLDAREVLRLTMPAPTVTGSPLAAACRTIAEHERTGRGYYGGVLALLSGESLDSALLIRTADIDAAGHVEIGVGATLVRHSDPAVEAAETRAKAAALLTALGGTAPAKTKPGALRSPGRALLKRNDGLSEFWRGQWARSGVRSWMRAGMRAGMRAEHGQPLANRSVVVVDAEDDFTAMLAQLTRALGLDVRVQGHDAALTGDHDLVIVGPGPGDPRDRTDARIARLHALTRSLLTAGTPFLAVCLGHQVLADELGLRIERLAAPAQGVQRIIPLSGRPERVGFYNTFTAVSGTDEVRCPITGGAVRLLRDPRTGAVHAMRMRRARSMQFHVESVLTEHGPAILRRMLTEILSEVPAESAGTVAASASPARTRPTSGR